MKLQDSDIIAAARYIRNKQNQRLHVSPSPLKRQRPPAHFSWVAIAAALVIGFVIGKVSPTSPPSLLVLNEAVTLQSPVLSPTKNHNQTLPKAWSEKESLVTHQIIHDTIYKTRIVHRPATPSKQQTIETRPDTSPSCSMLCDDIRYDLLSVN